MNQLTTLVISDTLIHQDENGHYCLNDFHRAAGGEEKHKPANFLRLDGTKALIEEIDHSSDLRSAVEVINGGNNRGTYAVKEIIYAYAMWISPAFSLKVIRAYDAMVTSQIEETKNGKPLLDMQNRLLDSQQAQIAQSNLRIDQLLIELGKAHGLTSGFETMYYEEAAKVARLTRSRGKLGILERRDIWEKNDEGWSVLEIAKWAYRSKDMVKRVITASRYL